MGARVAAQQPSCWPSFRHAKADGDCGGNGRAATKTLMPESRKSSVPDSTAGAGQSKGAPTLAFGAARGHQQQHLRGRQRQEAATRQPPKDGGRACRRADFVPASELLTTEAMAAVQSRARAFAVPPRFAGEAKKACMGAANQSKRDQLGVFGEKERAESPPRGVQPPWQQRKREQPACAKRSAPHDSASRPTIQGRQLPFPGATLASSSFTAAAPWPYRLGPPQQRPAAVQQRHRDGKRGPPSNHSALPERQEQTKARKALKRAPKKPLKRAYQTEDEAAEAADDPAAGSKCKSGKRAAIRGRKAGARVEEEEDVWGGVRH